MYAYRWAGRASSVFQTGTNWTSETAGAPPYAPGQNAEADFVGTGLVTGLANVYDFSAAGYSGLGFVFTGYFYTTLATFAGNDWLTSGTTLTASNYIAIGQHTDTQAASVAILAGSVLAETANGQGIAIGAQSTGTLGVAGAGAMLNMGANEISLGYGGGTGTLAVSSGGSVVGGFLDVGNQTGTGSVQVTGGTVRVGGGNFAGEVLVGAEGGRGLLSVSNFGYFTCSGLIIGSGAQGGAASQTDVALAQLSVFGTVQIATGSGLNVSFGALFTADTLLDAGTVTEAGQYTQAALAGSLSVTGLYQVQNQASLSVNYQSSGGGLVIDGNPLTPAVLTVDDATLYAAVTSLGGSYGSLGIGTLSVQDGGTATLASLSVSSATAGAPSLVSVTGTGSSLASGGGIYAGNWGAGAFTVSNGGKLSVGANGMLASLTIQNGSFAATAGAQVVMAGLLQLESGTSFTVSASTLDVAGLRLAGVATLSGGASVLSDTAATNDYALALDGGSGEVGQLSVSGSNTVLKTIGPASIQSGTLTVSAGATFSCQDTASCPNALLLVSPNAGDPASVLDVTGAGSHLAVIGQLLSYYAPGEMLSVAAGATATVNGDIIDANLLVGVDGSGSQLTVTGALSSRANDPAGGTTLSVTNGAAANLGGGSHIVQLTLGGTLSATGDVQIDAASGYGTIATTGTLAGGGILQASGGTLVVSGATLGGVLATGGGSTLVLTGVAADVSAMEFLAGGGTLVEANTAKLSFISDFGVNDFIDLTGIHGVTDSFANGTLTLLDSQHHAAGMLVFGAGYTASAFALSGDGHGGTKISFHG